MGADCELHPLIHTLPPRTSAPDVEKKKAEPKTPHFLSLNQDIVAWSQKQKCGLKYSHSQSLNGALKKRSRYDSAVFCDKWIVEGRASGYTALLVQPCLEAKGSYPKCCHLCANQWTHGKGPQWIRPTTCRNTFLIHLTWEVAFISRVFSPRWKQCFFFTLLIQHKHCSA